MDTISPYNDKELFQLIAEGHKAAFTQLFKKYTSRLVPFISGLTKSECITDEIIQETFMRVWFNREKLTVITDTETWIFRIASSVCYRFLKELLVDNKIMNVVYHESYYGNNEVFETARFHKLAFDVHESLRELTTEQRRVYRLSREKGLKIPEIAEELSISPNNVRNLLNSSVEFVQEGLQAKGHHL